MPPSARPDACVTIASLTIAAEAVAPEAVAAEAIAPEGIAFVTHASVTLRMSGRACRKA